MKKTITRIELVAKQLLINPQGVSELELVETIKRTSSRNEINELEHLLMIKFSREWETASNGAKFYRYSIQDKKTAQALLTLVSARAKARNAPPSFTETEVQTILDVFAKKEQRAKEEQASQAQNQG